MPCDLCFRVWTEYNMLRVFGVVTHGAGIVVLVSPLKKFGATSEVTGGVFGYASLLGGG